MPTAVSYPGVYIEEIPSGVRSITGVATSITAFVGRTRRGPVGEPRTINGYADFERIYGGLWELGGLGFPVRDFFLNGGAQAIVVRLHHFTNPAPEHQADDNAKISITMPAGNLTLAALYPGLWGKWLRASATLVNNAGVSKSVADRLGITVADLGPLFNLTVTDTLAGTREEYTSVSLTETSGVQRLDRVLARQSKLVSWKFVKGLTPVTADDTVTAKQTETAADLAAKTKDLGSKEKDFFAANVDLAKKQASQKLAEDYDAKVQADPTSTADDKKKAKEAKDKAVQATTDAQTAVTTASTARDTAASALAKVQEQVTDLIDGMGGSDGGDLKADDFEPDQAAAQKAGLFALENVDLFNLLCIPPYLNANQDVDPDLTAHAAAYCERRRAMLLVDIPSSWTDVDTVAGNVRGGAVGTSSKNAALFFPRLRQQNPLKSNQMETFAACGAVAGVFARTDTQRGVWKAPAGLDATLTGVPGLSVPLTDLENGQLNQLGVNCLRAMPAVGPVIWGSRTLQGADRLASEWKYIPIRRLALYIEESLYRGTQWVVFEPNDEPLWGQIRLNVGAFMNGLFRQGAFQGRTTNEAYFVKCDKEVNPPEVVNLGIVNIVVGFAPLKPAEFVVIKIQQMGGPAAS